MSKIKNFLRNINYLTKHSLWDQREEDIVYLTNKILSDGMYEYGISIAGVPELKILDQMQSLEMLSDNLKSFVRTGDGEIKLMMGMDQPFQKYDPEIAKRLMELLKVPREDMYIGINRNYFIPLIPLENWTNYRRNAYNYREFYIAHCDVKQIYFDATCTSFPFGYKDIQKEKTDKVFKIWKRMFEGKKIAIVCGEGILDSFEYDIFEKASIKRFIYGPRINGWDAHKEIMTKIQNILMELGRS